MERVGICEPGSIHLVDKGFLVHMRMFCTGVQVLMPPKLRRAAFKFTRDQAVLTGKIAKERIHVERAVKRLKAFKILANTFRLDQ
jgi:hypothetical protein